MNAMQAAPKQRVSEAEYLDQERRSSERHELLNGEIFAMAGASYLHVKIVGNLARSLGNRLQGRPCDVLPVDLRVCVSATGLYTYPDLSIVCGGPEFHPGSPDTILNPSVIFEVLSDSTEAYDRGAKFEHYQRLPSLREYLLVAQDQRSIARYERVEGGSWRYTLFTGDAVVPLPAVEIDLPLAEVYAKIEFNPDASTRAPAAS